MIATRRLQTLVDGWTRQAVGAAERAEAATDKAEAAALWDKGATLRECAGQLGAIVVSLAAAEQRQPAERHRIVWEQGPTGNLLGRVGQLPSWSFQIFYLTGAGYDSYGLVAPQLPGMAGVVARRTSSEELQEIAEEWLADFIRDIGAAFLAPAEHVQAAAS